MRASRSLAIEVPHERIAEFCRKWGIRKLSFFGSVTREDFDPERSDVDVLVEFHRDRIPGWEYYYDLPMELGEIVGRKIDMRTPAEISPHAMPRVREDLIEEYDERP
jgi:predicted nucleotidyltransferase